MVTIARNNSSLSKGKSADSFSRQNQIKFDKPMTPRNPLTLHSDSAVNLDNNKKIRNHKSTATTNVAKYYSNGNNNTIQVSVNSSSDLLANLDNNGFNPTNHSNLSSLSRSKLTLTGSKSLKQNSSKYILGDSEDDYSTDHGSQSETEFTNDEITRPIFGEMENKKRKYIESSDNNDYNIKNKLDTSFFLVQDEYIPDLNYSDIVSQWQEEEYNDENKKSKYNGSRNNSSEQLNKSNIRSKSSSYSNLFRKLHQKKPHVELSKYSTWSSTDDDDVESSSIPNDEGYGFEIPDQDGFTQSQPNHSPNASQMYRSSHAQVEPIPLPNVRALLTPPSALEVERRVSYNNNSLNENNSLNNYKSSFSPQYKLRTLPSNTALTAQLSSLRRKTSLPVPITKSSLESASVSSSMTHLPANISNNSNYPINKEGVEYLISLLPNDFLSLPYSHRKKIILNLLPPDKLYHYKLIMSLIKKFMLTSSRSNASLFNYGISNNDSYNNNSSNFTNFLSPTAGNTTVNNSNINNTVNNNNSNIHNNHPIHHTRHNSIASQYLSSFSPSIASLSSMPNNDTLAKSPSQVSNNNSFVTTFTRADDKGMQIFDHTLGKIIGFGAWGTIRECTHNKTGKCRAIKIVRFKNNEKLKNQVEREVSVWEKLSHPYILPLLDYKLEHNYAMYCLTERIDDGTLYDLVISWDDLSNTKIPHDKRCQYTIDLASRVIKAIKYMHSKQIIHGDIKLENCLLEKKKDMRSSWDIFLCDFGMSRNLSNSISKKLENSSNIGSLPYASPELISENIIGYESDVWAFGVMLYTMLLGKLPFKHGSESKLRDLIKLGQFDVESLQFLNELNGYKTLKDIVCGCLEVDTSKRWTVDKIEKALNSQLK